MLQNGRVRPEDLTTMTVVLDAAPITSYGIIINQLSPAEYKKLSKRGEEFAKVVSLMWATSEKPTRHVHLVERDDDLEGQDNSVKPSPEDFVDFFLSTTGMDIKSQHVHQVRVDVYEKKMEEMQTRLEKFKQDNEALEAKLKSLGAADALGALLGAGLRAFLMAGGGPGGHF